MQIPRIASFIASLLLFEVLGAKNSDSFQAAISLVQHGKNLLHRLPDEEALDEPPPDDGDEAALLREEAKEAEYEGTLAQRKKMGQVADKSQLLDLVRQLTDELSKRRTMRGSPPDEVELPNGGIVRMNSLDCIWKDQGVSLAESADLFYSALGNPQIGDTVTDPQFNLIGANLQSYVTLEYVVCAQGEMRLSASTPAPMLEDMCRDIEAKCEINTHCCSGICSPVGSGTDKVCTKLCVSGGTSCNLNSDCCSDVCTEKVCEAGDVRMNSMCSGGGVGCNLNSECCSGECFEKQCTKACRSAPASCELNSHCCSGLCTDKRCEGEDADVQTLMRTSSFHEGCGTDLSECELNSDCCSGECRPISGSKKCFALR